MHINITIYLFALHAVINFLFEVLCCMSLSDQLILKNCISLPQANHMFICSVLVFCTVHLYVFCCIYCVLMA